MHLIPNHPGTALVGCAGWAITREAAPYFAEERSHLERYAQVLGAVEINSSFYRPHRRTTYERWAKSVPEGFQFSVKLPREMSHQLRLAAVSAPLTKFVGEVSGLGDKLGCILVQLPPSAAFHAEIAEEFFSAMRKRFSCMLACEARHASWFGAAATELLHSHAVTRVEADPPKGLVGDFVPSTPERYLRLHGSPQVYYSSYSEAFLEDLKGQLSTTQTRTWVIFDNTASGAALHNALWLRGAGAASA